MVKEKDSGTRYLSPEEILPYVGEFGRFQKGLVALLFAFCFVNGYQILIIYFTGMVPSWQCVVTNNVTIDNTSKCIQKFNTSVHSADVRDRFQLPAGSWEYTEGRHFSVATQLTDDIHLLALMSGIFFIGWGIGALLWGWVCDRFGRKVVIFPAIAGIQLTCFVSGFMPNIYLVMLCRLIIGVLIPAVLIQPIILITELVGSNYRSIAAILPCVSFPIGYCLMCLKAYYLKNWQYLSIACSVPYVWLLLFYPIVPESVKWLHLAGRNDEVMEIFRKIARWNRKTLPSNIQVAKSDPSQTETVGSGSLFRSRKLILNNLVQCLIWCSSTLVFYGLQLAANDLTGAVYKDFCYMAIVAIPGILGCIWINDRFGRRHANLIPLFIASLASLAVAFTPAKGALKYLRLTFGMVGKIFATGTLESMMCWTAEIFPADVRSRGMGCVQVAARVGAFSAPFIAQELKKFNTSTVQLQFIIMALPAFAASIVGIYLPETKDQNLDSVSEESSVQDTVKYNNNGIYNEGAEMKDIVRGDADV